MEWIKHRCQDLLPIEKRKNVLSKNVHDSSRRSNDDQSFQRTIGRRSYTAAKLMSRKMSILKNLKTSQAFKKQAIKQIDPDIELNIKKLRQLPASLSVNADPSKLAKVLEDEEGDLVTPVQQKLLKRILNQVTLKQEPTTTPRRAPKKEFVTPSTIPFKVPKKEATVTPPVRVPKKEVTVTPPVRVPKKPENVSWDELTFAEEGPEPDLEGVVSKTLRKIWKTPQCLKLKTGQRVDKLGSYRNKEEKETFYLKFHRFYRLCC